MPSKLQIDRWMDAWMDRQMEIDRQIDRQIDSGSKHAGVKHVYMSTAGVKQ